MFSVCSCKNKDILVRNLQSDVLWTSWSELCIVRESDGQSWRRKVWKIKTKNANLTPCLRHSTLLAATTTSCPYQYCTIAWDATLIFAQERLPLELKGISECNHSRSHSLLPSSPPYEPPNKGRTWVALEKTFTSASQSLITYRSDGYPILWQIIIILSFS